ncbi:MAG: long-chain-fatty-acid--CoA ligase [Elusimicrobia bacterium]|nr:long-chain-fatty-acid--CoA ligase [Elusimicrobiota bacterium]MDE2237177.1 long-chain-fatty-acid--CoA ligase [Elusimicrobiota bacterium]MDE2425905.1 long-chain-fatty-acid--CoA ligase [Elusimicrobiota bacterium]
MTAGSKTLNDLVDEAAAAAPERPFLVSASGTLSFTQFRKRVLAAAAGLSAQGVKPGSCVAIIHRNDPDFVVAYFALSRLGAIAVPINFMVQKPDELAYMLRDCAALGAVTQREFLKGLREAARRCPSLRALWVTDLGAAPPQQPKTAALERSFSSLSQQALEPPAVAVAEGDTAAILYTSGTTGVPKGVMLTHRNLVTNCESSMRRIGIQPGDVGLCLLPMFHSFAWTANVLVALRLPGKLVVSKAIAPAKPWLGMMAKHGVTLFSAVPQVYALLAKEARGLSGLALRFWFFRKVRMGVSGAAPLSPAIQSAFEKALGVPILEGYGLTETSPVTTINTMERRKPGSVGIPIDGVRVKIVDEEERALPPGAEGEICIRGDNVMKGYHGLPDATREAFTRDGWFKTGDVGLLDEDGFLFIRDRKKDMIIIKGLKVFSAQVEAVLLEHPAVAEAAVVGIPDEHGDETIKAFLVLKPGASADKPALLRYCRERLDAYKRPRDIELVAALPKNALQKVLKRELRSAELAKRSGGTPASS